MSKVPEFIIEFRERIEVLRKQSELNESNFAKSIGIGVTTYRTLLGKNPDRSGSQGPTFKVLHKIITQLRLPPNKLAWLLTGEDPGAEREEPPLDDIKTTQLLTKAQAVLVSDSKPLVDSLTQNINSYFELIFLDK